MSEDWVEIGKRLLRKSNRKEKIKNLFNER